MKVIVKTEKKMTTVRIELKVPEDTGECNCLKCSECAYHSDYKRYSDCPHRRVMDYLESMEDDDNEG